MYDRPVSEVEVGGDRVPLPAQETGILFVEVCLRAVRPGGRVGIILPNGYLGNRGGRYRDFRNWLLQNARVAAVVGFPRFTFKKSGADVSASVVVLERREKPLADLSSMPDYPIHFNLVEKVGWDLQSNPGKWMLAGDEAADGHLVVTTGCTHFELIPGKEEFLPDLVFGLSSEAFRVQMRALATGSDGLSSIATEDICSIVLPRIASGEVRKQFSERITENKAGHLVLPRVARDELAKSAP